MTCCDAGLIPIGMKFLAGDGSVLILHFEKFYLFYWLSKLGMIILTNG